MPLPASAESNGKHRTKQRPLAMAEGILPAPGEPLAPILCPDIPREHHPLVPHACELPSHQRPRRLLRPLLRQLRKRFPPPSTRRHFPNPHLELWIIPADLPTGWIALRIPPVRMPPYSLSGLSPEAVSWAELPFSRRVSSCRRSSFSPSPFSELPSSPTPSWEFSSLQPVSF